MVGDESEEENYSSNANVIIKTKFSIRRSKKYNNRRNSSPFNPDIFPETEHSRRTSVFTTSSGETAINMDENYTQELTNERNFENIKLHKEVLNNVKMQPWNMRKKIKLVKQAKSYVKIHEGELQEQFTKTYSIKNILARWNIYFIKNLHHYRQEIANLSNWMIPWERRIKEIESHFGSVVASYFIFLRWLFWINVVTAGVLTAFIAIPEVIISSTTINTERKLTLANDKYNSTNFLTLWDFDGALKYTPLFYGWYTNEDNNGNYRLPLAYFMTELVVYIYSFVATLRKMAENSRLSKLSEKDEECIFSWKLFNGWDYMIGNSETAINRVMSIVMGFKEALLEEAERQRTERNWKLIWIRVFVNLTVLCLFAISAAAVVVIVQRSTEPEANSTLWRRNETAVVMSLISFLFPMILEFLGYMERYHPRKQLRIQLGRIMLLNLLNIFSLVFAQFDKINGMTLELLQFKNNSNSQLNNAKITNYSNPLPLELLTTNINSCKEDCMINYLDKDLNITYLINSIATMTMAILPLLLKVVPTYLPAVSISDTLNHTTVISNELDSTINLNSIENEYPILEISNYTMETFYNSSNVNESIDYNITDQFRDPTISQDYSHFILENTVHENVSLIWNKSNLLIDTFEGLFKSDMEYINSTIVTVIKRDVNLKYEKESVDFLHNVFTLLSFINQTISYNFLIKLCNNRCMNKFNNTNKLQTYIFSTTFESTSKSLNKNFNWNYHNLTKLRSLCWETMFGQEIVKLTVMDFIFTVVGIVFMDFIRGVFVRIMNKCWCWDLEKQFPEYGEFKVAENILHLVNNQGMVWMGMFFSPGIIVINVIKLMLLMYLRSWMVLTCNVPHSIIFRASRSNNFYFALLLTMLFLCVLPVGYAIVWVEPSWHCGPFSNYPRIFHILTKTVRRIIPPKLQKPLDYIVSPGIVIPLLILLILIIYYLISLTNSLREANADLRIQLRQERTEERRKMFQVANRQRRGGSKNFEDLDNTPYTKWKTLLNNIPSTKGATETIAEDKIIESELQKTKAVLTKFIQKSLRKPCISLQEESFQEDQHNSLWIIGDSNVNIDIKKDATKDEHGSLSKEAPSKLPKNSDLILSKIKNDPIDSISNKVRHIKFSQAFKQKSLINISSDDCRTMNNTLTKSLPDTLSLIIVNTNQNLSEKVSDTD